MTDAHDWYTAKEWEDILEGENERDKQKKSKEPKQNIYKKKIKTEMVKMVIGQCPFKKGLSYPNEFNFDTQCGKCDFNENNDCTWINYETKIKYEKPTEYNYEHKFPCYACGETIVHIDYSITTIHGQYDEHPTFKCVCGVKHKLVKETYSKVPFAGSMFTFAIPIGTKRFIPEPVKIITQKEKIDKIEEKKIKDRGARLEFKN